MRKFEVEIHVKMRERQEPWVAVNWYFCFTTISNLQYVFMNSDHRIIILEFNFLIEPKIVFELKIFRLESVLDFIRSTFQVYPDKLSVFDSRNSYFHVNWFDTLC
jgi:hypothetical protein